MTEIKEECAHLQDWVLAMSAEINDLQQRTRKNNLIISEVPLTKGENVYEILAYLAHLINFKFFRGDISVAHKLQVKKGDARPPSIVVKFVSRSVKTEWIYAWKLRRSLTADSPNQRLI